MKIVAVCACPSGVAHTYLAAASLKDAAKKNGFDINVETQGAIGIENPIKQTEVDAADCVIITNDTGLKNMYRFNGKKIYAIKASEAIKKADIIMKKIKDEITV
ncbi:MAG: PTS fructose-like transporter subunit IIB [Eubacteriaceae bacterium]|nr:PTS fructose-like transporter subunit IIB [Eubacteriaceae bacterium]